MWSRVTLLAVIASLVGSHAANQWLSEGGIVVVPFGFVRMQLPGDLVSTAHNHLLGAIRGGIAWISV